MIISHAHRYIFTAIPKTGTHAVRRALREHLGPDDIEQVRLFVEKAFPYAEIAALQHGHISLEQVRPVIGDDVFASYFKFAFVRNPYDRFVSYCAFVTREEGKFDRDPKAVMRHFAFKDRPWDHILFVPQYTFVADANGALLADQIGRVEEMQASYDAIAARIGIPTAQLERVNTSRRDDYRGYYDAELIEAVGAMYRRDLDLFGYGFEGPL